MPSMLGISNKAITVFMNIINIIAVFNNIIILFFINSILLIHQIKSNDKKFLLLLLEFHLLGYLIYSRTVKRKRSSDRF